MFNNMNLKQLIFHLLKVMAAAGKFNHIGLNF